MKGNTVQRRCLSHKQIPAPLNAMTVTLLFLAVLTCILCSSAGAFDPKTDTKLVAMHPSGVTYWGPDYFANGLAIENNNWKDKATGQRISYQSPQLDSEGNPQYLAPGQVLQAQVWNNSGQWHVPSSWPNTMMYDGHHILDGRTTLTWKGTADIRVANPQYQISGSSSGMQTDGTRVYRTSTGHMKIEIYAIDPADPPSQIRVWLPDPNDWEGASLTNKLFYPAFLDRTADAQWSYIRFMDMVPANNCTMKEWQDRRRPADTFQTGIISERTPIDTYPYNPATMSPVCSEQQSTGVAFEYMVQLCNTAQSDMYITIPHLATDEFITKLARLIQFGSDGNEPYDAPQAEPLYPPLDGNLKVFVEYSNEIWNPLFGQWYWAREEANARGMTEAQFKAERFSNYWALFEAAMGQERVVRVAAVWSGQAYYTQNLLDEFYNNPALLEPEVAAMTTYFGHGIQNWVHDQNFYPTTAEPWTDPYWQSQQFAEDMNTTFDYWMWLALEGRQYSGDTGPDAVGSKGLSDESLAVIKSYGLPVIAYEGGPSIYTDHLDGPAAEDDGITLFMVKMNNESRFAEIYDAHLNMCRQDGLYTHMPFVLAGGWSKWGQWGHLWWLTQDPCDSVKWQEILGHIDEFSSIRYIDDPCGAAPAFVTDSVLPWGVVCLPYSQTIEFIDGDGPKTVKTVATSLADGLSFDQATMTVSGIPRETRSSHVYLRLTDADDDPAWRDFVINVAPKEVGLPLLEWEFASPPGGSQQSGTSTYNHAAVVPSVITTGPGLNKSTNSYYNDDAFGVTGAEASSLNLNDYLKWTVQPKDGNSMSLLSIRLGAFDQRTGDDFYVELRFSDNAFATYTAVPLAPANPLTGKGLSSTAGIELTADLSEFTSLQQRTSPTEFRLYIWGLYDQYNGCGIGKLGASAVDMVISGMAGDGPGFCVIDFDKFSIFAQSWLEAAENSPADMDNSGRVDRLDLGLFADQWLCCCPQTWTP